MMPEQQRQDLPEPTSPADAGHAATFDKTAVYPILNSIRFIAICSIIWGHSLLGDWEKRRYDSLANDLVRSIVMQLGKLGTINFFLISGFLLADKLPVHTTLGYFKKRWKTTYLPFLFFVYFCVIIELDLVTQNIYLRDYHEAWNQFYIVFIGALFYSSYWFIIVFFISTSVLVAFKKYTGKVWFGLLLFTITLFYSVNMHYNWTAVSHTKAFLGYIFYMWMGTFIHSKIEQIMGFLKRVPWAIIGALFIATFLLASYEGFVLTRQNSADAFASTRFTNLVTCMVFFFLLLKFGSIKLVNRMDPQRTVFAIFLIQNMVVFELMGVLNTYVADPFGSLNLITLFLIQVIFFCGMVYLNYFLADKLTRSSFRWLVGLR